MHDEFPLFPGCRKPAPVPAPERSKDVDALSQRELRMLVDWFTYYMPMEQRRRFMAEMPVTYARLFPSASAGAVITSVRDALTGRDS